jgi:hypothetical protein
MDLFSIRTTDYSLQFAKAKLTVADMAQYSAGQLRQGPARLSSFPFRLRSTASLRPIPTLQLQELQRKDYKQIVCRATKIVGRRDGV